MKANFRVRGRTKYSASEELIELLREDPNTQNPNPFATLVISKNDAAVEFPVGALVEIATSIVASETPTPKKLKPAEVTK
jgi:hypothetical protein